MKPYLLVDSQMTNFGEFDLNIRNVDWVKLICNDIYFHFGVASYDLEVSFIRSQTN